MISHFLRKLLAEHSVGLEQQHQNQQSKGEGVAEDSDRVIRLDQRFTDTDYIRAEDSPGDRADAAEDRGNKGLESGHGADGRADLTVIAEVKN